MKRKSSKLFVGMDVHKEYIDIASAEEGSEVRHFSRIGGDLKALSTALTPSSYRRGWRNRSAEEAGPLDSGDRLTFRSQLPVLLR